MRKIGIMGGTFDPVHNGHLMLADTAYRQFDLDQVWFLPNGNPPHKKEENIGTDARHRSRMVALAIQGRDYCRLEEYEVRRREVSCSYQTLEHFRKQYPEDEFYFIIGADSLFAIETWVHPERIFPACVILAACRDDHDTLEEMKVQIEHLKTVYPKARIQLLRSPLIPVSSSEIRRKIRAGLSIAEEVPEEVEAYIKEEELYEP
ncbi:nicotinate-nucleotide adenylyltransferase [Massilistercora timonensis]|uniref:nicotinate-nucleotide adenylyltransferase n=1 Tax=Massilistercora timonensis TaxID=2086584 RepID=UPI003209B21E